MPKIMISLNEIKRNNPFIPLEGILESKNKTEADDEKFPLSEILPHLGPYNDLQTVIRLLDAKYHKLWIKYVAWCAFRVKHLMCDKRSIDALDMAWKYADGKATEEELLQAEMAADEAVNSAHYAAYYRDFIDAIGVNIDRDETAKAIIDASKHSTSLASKAAKLVAETALKVPDLCDDVADHAAHFSACSAARAEGEYDQDKENYNVRMNAEKSAQTEKLKKILDAGEWVND